MIHVAIAEDHQSLVDALRMLLEREKEINISGTVNDGEALLDLVRLKHPDVVITDIRMPKIDGIAATRLIKKEFPHIKILAFTMYDQTEAVEQMLEAGASGYILKSSSLKEILHAIKTVAAGDTYFDAHINTNALGKTEEKTKKGVLTKRQIEILKLVAQGKTSREIADQLLIGIYTVDTHRKNMIRVLGLKGRGELLRYAVEMKYKF